MYLDAHWKFLRTLMERNIETGTHAGNTRGSFARTIARECRLS